jgi:hypothetical protein
VDKERIVSHVKSLVPEISAFEISAYMLELLEMMRTEGKTVYLGIDNPNGKNASIPQNVKSVISVFCDGEEIPQSLPSSDFDYTGISTDSIDNADLQTINIGGDGDIAEEGILWGTSTYLITDEGMLVDNEGKYLTEG